MTPLTPSVLDPLIPIIVAIVKQSGFDRRWNAMIAIAVYVVWTAVSLFTGLRAVPGPITPEVFLSSLVTAAATGFVTYELVLKNLGEQTLEQATSIFKGPVSDPVLDEPTPPSDPAAQGPDPVLTTPTADPAAIDPTVANG